MAIKASHHQLVDYMVNTCVAMKGESSHKQPLDVALRKKMTEGKTCLHLAMKENLDPKTRRILVENASDEALAVQDDAGKTPMHYAAGFKRCTNDGAELIYLFIERDLKTIKRTKGPLKTFLDLSDSSGDSVYLLHRKEWRAEKSLALGRGSQNPPRTSTSVDKPEEAAKTKSGFSRARNSKNNLQSLKLHYMRTRSTEMVISFLYSSNLQDIQVSFDYDKLPRQIQWTSFLNCFGADATSDRLKFDSVLQYVTFPRVQVQIKGRQADCERETEKNSGMRQHGVSSRKDMKYFFDWLYDKGVRHIVTLSVEDSKVSGEKVHSDQIMQKSLEKFTIEHLDWRKTDLDPETILHVGSKAFKAGPSTTDNEKNAQPVAQQLRQLSLKWTGSNSVLRAWSELEGLPLLPRLQRIQIYKPSSEQEFDSPQWISTKIKNFQIRLNANRKAIRDRESRACAGQNGLPDDNVAFCDVEVDVIDSDKEAERTTISHDASHFSSTIPTGVNSHRWLHSATRFATEMELFWHKTTQEFTSLKLNRDPEKKIASDVTIALIDDGVDMFDSGLSDRVLEGKSFDFHDGKVRPSFSSADEHGTSNIDADYAAQTLPMSEDKSVHEALKKAIANKALMFCSAPDEGKFTKLDYPSGPWREDFFRIGAARADGTVFQWTQEDGITYVLPGVEVVRDQVNSSSRGGSAASFTKRVEDFKYETGSSVATALAAGLAAMIIYCVKSSILNMKIMNQNKGPIIGTAIGDNDANLIAAPDAMKRAFARLGHVTKNNIIQVWETFDEINKTLEILRQEESSPEKVQCIERFVKFGSKLADCIRA
ncbi:hypothetical protein ACQKWADRAFT_323111 [Trichoderma austrokoningii]